MASPGFFNQFMQQKSASNPQGMFSRPEAQSRFLPQGSTLTSNGQSPFVSRPGTTMRATMARDPNSTNVEQAQRDYETYQTGDTRQALQQAQQRAAQPTQRPQPTAPGMKPVSGPGANWANNFMSAKGAMNGAGGTMNRGGGLGGAFGMLSDRSSKTKIKALEDELQKTYAALGGGETEKPDVRAPDVSALDSAAGYKGVGSYSYDYKNPKQAGAAPGTQSGPMADELKSLPGVVEKGPDGMDRVNEPRLTLNNASAIGQQQRDIDALKKRLAAIDPNAVNEIPSAEYPSVGY